MDSKEALTLKIVTGVCFLGSILFANMSFHMPIEVKDCFNVSDSFWIGWGYIFIICAIVWGVGFISSFSSENGTKTNAQKNCKEVKKI